MGLSSHQRAIGKSQTHLTPRWLLDALGPFDLDPCAAPDPRPWPTAARHIVEAEDGLSQPWKGRVWMNPPFDSRVAGRWLGRLRDHGDGIALVHARTEAAWFRPAWDSHGVMFLSKRVTFCTPDGVEQEGNSGAPVALIAFGKRNREILEGCDLEGALIMAWYHKGSYGRRDLLDTIPLSA
ncbi:MAG: adenine methyltransferase [Parafilimonas terrae]|nr:adenine methyltransferase [Parafilimonas terrae]